MLLDVLNVPNQAESDSDAFCEICQSVDMNLIDFNEFVFRKQVTNTTRLCFVKAVVCAFIRIATASQFFPKRIGIAEFVRLLERRPTSDVVSVRFLGEL